jgi:predicted amidohydrolase YtcJ
MARHIASHLLFTLSTLLLASVGMSPVASAATPAAVAATAPVTLIIKNANIWTVDERRPAASALAIADRHIVLVGSDREVMKLADPGTQVLDLKGAFVLPGFTDTHTHFGNAAAAFYEVRVVDVNDEALLLDRLRAKVNLVPKGMWITGYDWASVAASRASRSGNTTFVPLSPSLEDVDRITPDHPVLLRRYDGAYFINSRGLQLARIDRHTPNPANGEYVRHPQTHELTGMLLGSAGNRMALTLPPTSRARDLIAAQSLLRTLNSHGITSIHDIAHVEEISQTHTWSTDVERSTTDLDLFKDLRTRGELTVRVYPILTLASWRDYRAFGIVPGTGDDLIRYGALKQFIDGSIWMSKPYANRPESSGGFSFRVDDERRVREDIVGADALGFDTAAHVTGDRGHQVLLDWYEDAIRTNPARDRRFRLIHAWYPSRADIERAGRMHAIADVQPWQLLGELPEMVDKLGPQRAALCFPWRTMMEQGVRITLGSDWPGSFDRSSVAAIDPIENIYYAVTRQRLDGTPAGGWHPEQRMSIDEAIRAYTLNGAYAAREENIKGSLTEGKLADVVVLTKDLRRIAPRDIPSVRVRYTIFDGRIVYASDAAQATN